jgi:threonine synthase
MDVGAPSNFERILALYSENLDALRHDLTGVAYDDTQIVGAIGDVHRRYGYLLDPHGAVGWLAINEVLRSAPADTIGVFLATAHPAKFREVVEPAIGRAVPLPDVLADAVRRPRMAIPMPAEYRALTALLRS